MATLYDEEQEAPRPLSRGGTMPPETLFWEKLAAAAARFADVDGVIRLPNACLVAAGQRLRSA